MGVRLLVLISLSVLEVTSGFAQTLDVVQPGDLPARSKRDNRRPNTASILFDRNINTFNWIGRAEVDTTISGLRIRLNEDFISNTIKDESPGASRSLQSDQQILLLRLSNPIFDGVRAETEWSSLSYTDNKAVGLNAASSHLLLGGLRYEPVSWVQFSPLIGYRWENQLDYRDRGLAYKLSGWVDEFDYDGYRLDADILTQRERVTPRLQGRDFGRFVAQKRFVGNTRDSLDARFSRTQREFYASGGNAIDSRVEQVYSFTNLLDYEFDRNFVGSLFMNIAGKELDKDSRSLVIDAAAPIRFSTGIEEFKIETFLQTTYRSDDEQVTAMARLTYSERNERHFAKPLGAGTADSVRVLFTERNAQEQTKDNLARRTAISGGLAFPFSYSDRLSISGTAGILRYDTPSLQNVEDRDELLMALSVSSSHAISPNFDLSVTLDGTLSHLVYLLRDRSANNNYNRVLRLTPRTSYRPFHWLSTTNAFEVLANYTVYDFEQQLLQVRSFSYRQFGWLDSTSIDITNRTGLDFFVYLKLYERGQLNWHEFTERRENSFADKTYDVQLRFSPAEETTFAIGYRYFSQSRYGYDGGERTLIAYQRSVGPTCAIRWRVNRFSSLALRGWYEQQKNKDGATRDLPNMSMNISINL